MDAPLQKIDWSLVETFLAVAETGSLSAAARRLGRSQPTIGRQMREIEEHFGAAMFRRQAKGMDLTEAGEALLAPAREMREAASRFNLIAASATGALTGTVRITASLTAAHYILPPIISDIRRAEPEIALDIVPSDSVENLLFREADIAVRMFRPTQLEVVTRHLGNVKLALFGAKSYLDRVGRPKDPSDLPRFDFVGYDQNPAIIDGFRSTGWEVDRDFFRTRCDNNPVNWELMRAGCGLGFGAQLVGERDPDLEEIPLGIDIPPIEIWLTAHAALRQSPRIRRVWDLLADGLTPLIS